MADLEVCLRLLFIPLSGVFPKEVKNSLSSAGQGAVILCSVGMPAHQLCWGAGVFFFLISPLLVEMPDLDVWALQGAGHHCVFALKALLQGCQLTSLRLPSSSSRVLRGVSVSKVPPHLPSLFLASEEAFWTKFPTFSWLLEQIKAQH